MNARRISCKIVAQKWLSPSVMSIRFEPSRSFNFDSGQFLSIYVPTRSISAERSYIRRAYSFAAPVELGYELCIKRFDGGAGSNYLTRLRVGDRFEAAAPYGDFVYHPQTLELGRSLCMICTGTGLAPFRSMLLSRQFASQAPEKITLLFGARAENEILYPGFFEKLGIDTVHALSQPSREWRGARGRVTDYLHSLPSDWAWHSTDFYICGGGAMIEDVRRVLSGRGVPVSAIHQEVYFEQKKTGIVLPPAIPAELIAKIAA